MSSQPYEHDHEDPMNHLLDEFTHLQETSTVILLDDHFDTDYAEAINLLLPSLDHHHLVPNSTSSASIYLQEHVISDHLHKPTTETAHVVDEEETRRGGRGKEVAVLDEHHEHEHGHEHDEEGGNSSCAKKQEHNAKERLRRMKLQASYLALGTLLPDSPASKKKWSAPTIIDGVLMYVPELQAEVEQLTLRKQQIMTAIENKKHSDKGKSSSRDSDPVIPAVSVYEVGRDREVIVQICTRNESEDGFADLLLTIESQGMTILSASSAQVCADQRIFSYHLHVKMHEDLSGADNITVMREKIISLLV